ncbi:MAG: hypothetical protein H6686_08255 [Fibrobacteria bacterium]|nr:hypothetical protein [Fibrobacteria bacterium]
MAPWFVAPDVSLDSKRRNQALAIISALAVSLALAGNGTLAEAVPALATPACLSLSPLRALPAAHLDSAQGAWWRDRLIDSLEPLLAESSWQPRRAGDCPEDAPILDGFQEPGDLTRDEDGALVKIRLEWRHQSGSTIALLDDPDHPEQQLGIWARQVALSARLQLASVDLESEHPLLVRRLDDNDRWTRMGSTPVSWAQPPGRLRLSIHAPGQADRILDTLLMAGRSLRLSLPSQPPKPKSFWEWPTLGASALCLAAGLWYSLEMDKAYAQYSRLDQSATPGEFSSSWDRVRSANLLRNSFLAGSGALLSVAAYIHFR